MRPFLITLGTLLLFAACSCSTRTSQQLGRQVALALLREKSDALLNDERPLCQPFPGQGAPGRVKIGITDITDDLTKAINVGQEEKLEICQSFVSAGILKQVSVTTEDGPGVFSPIHRRWFLYDIVNKEFLQGNGFPAATGAFDSITGIIQEGAHAQATAQILFKLTDTYKTIRNIIVQQHLNVPRCPEINLQPISRTYAFTRYDDGWRLEDSRIESYAQFEKVVSQRAREAEQQRISEEQELLKQQEDGQRWRQRVGLGASPGAPPSGEESPSAASPGLAAARSLVAMHPELKILAVDDRMGIIKMVKPDGSTVTLTIGEAKKGQIEPAATSDTIYPTQRTSAGGYDFAQSMHVRHDHGSGGFPGEAMKDLFCEGVLSIFKDKLLYEATGSNDKRDHSFSVSYDKIESVSILSVAEKHFFHIVFKEPQNNERQYNFYRPPWYREDDLPYVTELIDKFPSTLVRK